MKKRIKIIFAAIVAIILAFGLVACSDKDSDSDVALPAETIHIASVADFVGIRNYLGAAYKNYTFVLDADIDLNEIESWEPIGDSVNNAFYGTLDGNNKAIKNINFIGWNSDYSPIIDKLGKDKGIENTTSFSTMALFGYVNGASFKDLTVNNVNFSYYVDDDYGYAAGLAAYSIGASSFKNIAVDGKINFNNTYQRNKVYYDNGECKDSSYNDVTIYVGGINAFSSGDAVFENVSSNVSYNNEFTRAYLYNESNAEPEDIAEGTVEEEYRVEGRMDNAFAAASQIFVGGICGVLKGGKISDATAEGNYNIFAKSVYIGGITAAGYNCEIKDAASSTVVKTSVHVKSAVGGIVALVDNGTVSECTVQTAEVKALNYGSVQSTNVGGIFAFACNASDTKACDVTLLKVTVTDGNAAVGGIGGVLRDAKLSASSCTKAEFLLDGKSHKKENCDLAFAAVVNSVYNNSELTLKEGAVSDITVTYHEGSYSIDNSYCRTNSTSYVDEDGKLGIRLFLKDRTDKFVYAFAKISDGALCVSFYNEELTLITERNYERAEGFVSADNLAEKYLDVFFEAGKGIRDSVEGAVTIEGRDMSLYEYRSGVPSVPEK